MKVHQKIILAGVVTLGLTAAIIPWARPRMVPYPPRSDARTVQGQAEANPSLSPRTAAAQTTPTAVAGVGLTANTRTVGWEPVLQREPDITKLDAFDAWLKRWAATDAAGREALVGDGVALASARRPQFKALIAANPRRALERSVPRVIRQDLPAEISALLEIPLSAKGQFVVKITCDCPTGNPVDLPHGGGRQALTERFFVVDGTTYKARVAGELERLGSRGIAPLRGVVIDDEMAVAANAVRVLEVGERIPAGAVVESLRADAAAVGGDRPDGARDLAGEPVVEIAGRLIAPGSRAEVAALEQDFHAWVLHEYSGSNNAGFFLENFPNPAVKKIGNYRLLYVRIKYPDRVSTYHTEESAEAQMREVERIYGEWSYGKLVCTTTITPMVTIPWSWAYGSKDVSGYVQDAVRKLGYDPEQYDTVVICGDDFGGVAYGNNAIVGGSLNTTLHEVGHRLGAWHAGFWSAIDGTGYGYPGANSDIYGNIFDIMGNYGISGDKAHFSVMNKLMLGWLSEGDVHRAKTNTVYRIHAFDQPHLEQGKRYALVTTKDRFHNYYLEYRPSIGGLVADSALVLMGNETSEARLVDATPHTAVLGSGTWETVKHDSGIAVGRTFSDLEADLHFTVVSRNATTPPSLDIAVNRGPFPGNQAPALAAILPSADNVAVGDSIIFDASAAVDADGDTLAYNWDFDDGVSAPNAPVISRTFTSAAQVTAMVTVSDMKGGTVRRHVVVNIGNHGNQTITGTITRGGQPMENVYLAASGGKYAFTDRDGNYALSNLRAGNTTLTATSNGYSLVPSFANPLTVVAGANTADWTATATATFVTLAAVSDAHEGGTNGIFRFTRTGSTAADLLVRVAEPGATAAIGTDYTMSPDRTVDSSQKYWTFTIPAGQATLDVAVAAVNDSLAEGPETVRLQLSHNGSYLLDSAGAAVMRINDNDTALPQVAVVATDPYATEFPADSGTFTFTRTGSTVAALNLSIGWGGTAANGMDYSAVPTTITIPAGQASATLLVSPQDDNGIESAETILVTIQPAAASYVIESNSGSALIQMADDDVPLVTVSVPDASAAESGSDSGLFLVHRSGSTAAPLKVYYGLRGSALHGADYAPLPGEVVIPAGARSAPVLISPVDDGNSEGSETVVLVVATVTAAYTPGAVYAGTVTLSDNEGRPVISVRGDAIGTEGGGNASVIFRASGGGAGNVTVNYNVTGTATSGVDFTALSGSIVIPANGINDVTLTIPIINDTAAEATENVVVTVLQDDAYSIEHGGSAEALIRDNDSGSQRVNASVTTQRSPSEAGPTTGSFYISRTDSAADLVVNYELSGTAANGIDYINLPGTVTIPAGQTGVAVDLIPINDSVAEGIETVILTVLPGAGYSPETLGVSTLEIADNEVLATTVGFQSPQTLTSELPGANGVYRDIEVRLSAASPVPVSVDVVGAIGASAHGDNVDWAFIDAENGNAILPFATLSFAPGITSRNVRIRVNNDGLTEGIEVVTLALLSPRGASLSSTAASHRLFLFDGAVPPIASLVTEERWNTGAVFTNNTWDTVAPNTTGLLSGFTPVRNAGENFSRRLTGLLTAPATGSYTFWIASDDASKLFISTDATAANKVQRANLSVATSFQNWSSNPSQQSVPLNLVAGQSYYVEVQHQEGGGDDHVSVAWEGPGFNRKELMAAPPDDLPRTLRFATGTSARTEAGGMDPGLVVFLDRPAGPAGVSVNFTVDGNATTGSDYTLAATSLEFAPGESTCNIPLAVFADGVAENPEWLRLSLTNPVGATLGAPFSHMITIHDSSAPVIATLFAKASSTMAAGADLGGLVATVTPPLAIANWSIIAGNTANAFTISPAGRLILATPAALPNPGGMQLIVRATDASGATGDGVVNVLCNGPANGVVEQRWAGSLPYNFNNWAGLPIFSGYLPTFTSAQNIGDNFSRRLTGYLKPGVSGDYTFWVAGDDQCRLFLSEDESPASMRQIASVGDWTGYQQWDADQASIYPRQKSAVIPLVAGKLYWLEVHHVEFGGGDHVSIAWQRAGGVREPLPAEVIFPTLPGMDFDSPIVPPMIVMSSPTAGSAIATGTDITMNADVAGGSATVTAVEFYRESTLVGVDSSSPYSALWTNPQVGNHALTAKVIFDGGSVTSSEIAITVYPSDPAADPDGDGFTTALELSLGTNPYAAASQPAAIYAGLLGWWKLDESGGSIAADATGRPQDGAVTGATWVNGVLQNGLAFDGLDDQVNMPLSLLSGRPAFTLATYFRTPTGQVAWRGLLGQNDAVELGIDNNQIKVWTAWGGIASTPMPATGVWHHLACVADGSTVKLYVDGELRATGGVPTANYGASSYPFRIGGGVWNNSGGHFAGEVDDVRVYSRALNAAEVLSIANPPVFVVESLSHNVNEGDELVAQLEAHALLPGGALAYSKLSGPDWLSVAADGKLGGTPGTMDVGANICSVQVQAATGGSAIATLSVVVNGIPRFTDLVNILPTAVIGSAYQASLNALATDPEGQELAFTLLSGPAWISLGANGSIQGNPGSADFGEHRLIVRVTDPRGASSQGMIAVSVNAPEISENYGQLYGRDTGDEWIQRVRFADLDHTSGDNSGYADLRAHRATMTPGQTVNYILTPGWSGTIFNEAWTIWIDLNRDGDFDEAGERVLQLAGSKQERTGALQIPSSAAVGLTRMRIAMKYNSAQTSPTGNFTYGEVEDYAVMLGNPLPANAFPYFLGDPLVINFPPDGQPVPATLAGLAGDWENHAMVFAKLSGPEWLGIAPDGAITGTPPAGISTTYPFTVSVTDSMGGSDTAVLMANVTASGYATWLVAMGLEGADAMAGADPDADGIPNSIEFVIGGEPAGQGASSRHLLPEIFTDATHVAFMFRRTEGSAYLNPLVEYSGDMVDWFPAVHGRNGITIGTENNHFGPGIDRVTVWLPQDLAGGARLFVHLKVGVD